MILNKLKQFEIHNKNLLNKTFSLININKRTLFMKQNSGLSEDSNKNQINLDNIFSFNSKQMKIIQNKVILNQNHLGLKTTKNDTYLVYQTEESNFFILGKKLLVFVIFMSFVEIVRRYKKEGTAKYVLYALFGGLSLYSLIHPRFNLSNSIKKIELNKTLDLVYVTLFNNKMLKIANNDVYLSTNFRHMENFDSKRFVIGIKGKNYFATLRYAYIPNFDLFNCAIRGFQFGHDSQKF
jgi:hypothetical protein